MTTPELQEQEQSLGKWTLNYIPPTEGHYLGKLQVTDQRLIFEAQFDTSVKGVINETLFYQNGNQGFVNIPKSMIKNVEAQKSFFKKKVILTLENGEQHTFDYGMMGIGKLVEAIKQ